MIRQSIARHIGPSTLASMSSGQGPSTLASMTSGHGPSESSGHRFHAGGVHASHALLPLARGGDADEGACLIEPAVRCNHCGYCVSYGH